jgi:hypothetical protein
MRKAKTRKILSLNKKLIPNLTSFKRLKWEDYYNRYGRPQGEGGLGCSFLPSPGKNLRTAMIIGFDSSYEFAEYLPELASEGHQKSLRPFAEHGPDG